MKTLAIKLHRALLDFVHTVRAFSRGTAILGKGGPLLGLLSQHWPLLLAGLSAIGAFFLTQSYAESKVMQERERLLPKGGLIEVLVAARDLGSGDIASPQTVAVRRMPQEWSLPGAIMPLDFDSINQRRVVRAIKAGHPLTVEHLRQGPAEQNGVRLEPGYRAISISVDEVSSVGGLIQPGDRVDLWGSALPLIQPSESGISSLPTDRTPVAPRARLIAENLRVLATGAKTERRSDQAAEQRGPNQAGTYATITLAVPVGLANLVLAGQLQGRLGIALRAAEELPRPAVVERRVEKSAPVTYAPIEILIGSAEGGLR
ncbi:MAG: Flp pilus assembly protein CpaB [Betaproteobacteria bacterium]|nr:Flp pilus assembly protein CpaB [Betaproteobacteria bacterium]